MNRRHLKLHLAVSSAVVALCGSTQCLAQAAQSQGAAAPTILEGVIVTANKRSENINTIGVSITAASGETLREAGVISVEDLAKVVPGFHFTQSLYGTPVFTMRGIGFNTTALGISPAVSVYVDEVPLPYPAMTTGAGLDVQRVEAIKGPQGVLFGANSTGGAINYVAAEPTEALSAGAILTYQRFGRFDGEAFVSGPLSDEISTRISVRAEQGGAWQISRSRPGDRQGDADRLMGRVLLDFTPEGPLSLRLNLSGWRDQSETQARRAVQLTPLLPGTGFGLPANAFIPQPLLAAFPQRPADSRTADWDADRSLRNDKMFFQGSLRATYDLSDSTKLTAIAAHSYLRPDSEIDADGTAYRALLIMQRGSIRSSFGEVRIDSQLTDKLSLLLGVNYQQDSIRDSLTTDVNASIYNFFFGDPRGVNETRANTTAKTSAIFSKLDYQLTEQVKLIAAVRYTDDRRLGVLCSYDVNGTIAKLQNLLSGTSLKPGDCATATNGVARGPIRQRLNEDNFSFRFGAEWKVTPEALIYATANQGFKAGGFPNVFAFEAVQLRPVVQERLRAYELGSKLALLDHKVQLNGAIFHYDYQNKQIQGRTIVGVLGAVETLVNVPESSVNGAEVELAVAPVTGLALKAAATYVDSQFASGTRAYTPFGDFANVGGQQFPDTPKWQVNLDGTYERPLSDRLNGFVGASVVHTSSVNSAFGDLPLLEVPGYTILDARLGVSAADDQWKVTLFARNLTDRKYFYSTIQNIDVLTRYYGTPRVFGISVQAGF